MRCMAATCAPVLTDSPPLLLLLVLLVLLVVVSVSAYVTHGVFPKESWNKFKADNGGRAGRV